MSLTRGAVSGLKWTYGGSAVAAILQLGFTAVMGRLLTPADFGLIAMALVFLRFGSYFAQMGVGSALVQKPSLRRNEIRAGFTSGWLLGLVFAGAVSVAAPLAITLFSTTSAIVPVVRALSLTFVLNGAGIAGLGLLRRELRFRALALVQTASYALGYLVVGIAFALLGAGVWSLVAAALAQALLQTVLGYLATRHPVAPLLAPGELRALYGFGSRVSLISFFEFLGETLDVIFIARYAGRALLGQYNRASLLVVLPFSHVLTGMSRVLFPAFSRIQAERDRLRSAYLVAMRVAAAFLLPTAAGIAVAAPELVRVVLGPQWAPAARVLPFLAVAVAINMLSLFPGIVCEATAVLNRKLLLQLTFVALLAVLLFAVRGDALVPYAAALAGAQLVRQLMYMRLMTSVLAMTSRDHASIYVPALAGSAIVALVLTPLTIGLRFAGTLPQLLLAIQLLIGAFVLLVLLRMGPLSPAARDLRARLAGSGALGTPGSASRRIAESVLGGE